MTLKEIVADLEDQISWRGPGGQPQGHVVIPRSEAQELLAYIRDLISAADRAPAHEGGTSSAPPDSAAPPRTD